MKITEVKAEDKRNAAAAGFKKKAPKKPKKAASAKEHTLERWIDRYNDWAKELKEAAKDGKKLADMRDSVRNAKR